MCIVQRFLSENLGTEERDVRGAGAELEEHEVQVYPWLVGGREPDADDGLDEAVGRPVAGFAGEGDEIVEECHLQVGKGGMSMWVSIGGAQGSHDLPI